MKYKRLIAKSFKEKSDKIEKNKKLEDFNWDSLTKISLITEVHKVFNKNLDYKKFDKIKTFDQLNKLIEKTVK
tara:strand:+ start:187 stop:405 length:219 start_codon:yes stop_codon:yes gene_type:complete